MRRDEKCVFCAKVVDLARGVVAFRPLNPVTPGHLLVVPVKHVKDVSEDPATSAEVMRMAADLAKEYPSINIITSKGEAATQTVQHLHLHLVPRTPGDGLKLPWSDQESDQVRPHHGLNNGSGNGRDTMPNLNLDTPEEGTDE